METITIRVTKEDKAKLNEAATKARISLSGYIRTNLLNKTNND